MTQSDDDLKATILARRARFVALALSASGLTAASLAACGGKTSGADGDTQPVQSSSPMNTGTPPTPTACLTIATTSPTANPTATPTPCLSPPMPTVTTTPTTSPTPCLSIAPEPTPCLEPLPPMVPVDAGPAPLPEPTACLSPAYYPIDDDTPVVIDAGVDAGPAEPADASVTTVPTPCLGIALPLDAGDAAPAPTSPAASGTAPAGSGGASEEPQGT